MALSLMKGGWRSASTMSGAQFVIMDGLGSIPWLSADNSDTQIKVEIKIANYSYS